MACIAVLRAMSAQHSTPHCWHSLRQALSCYEARRAALEIGKRFYSKKNNAHMSYTVAGAKATVLNREHSSGNYQTGVGCSAQLACHAVVTLICRCAMTSAYQLLPVQQQHEDLSAMTHICCVRASLDRCVAHISGSHCCCWAQCLLSSLPGCRPSPSPPTPTPPPSWTWGTADS